MNASFDRESVSKLFVHLGNASTAHLSPKLIDGCSRAASELWCKIAGVQLYDMPFDDLMKKLNSKPGHENGLLTYDQKTLVSDYSVFLCDMVSQFLIHASSVVDNEVDTTIPTARMKSLLCVAEWLCRFRRNALLLFGKGEQSSTMRSADGALNKIAEDTENVLSRLVSEISIALIEWLEQKRVLTDPLESHVPDDDESENRDGSQAGKGITKISGPTSTCKAVMTLAKEHLLTSEWLSQFPACSAYIRKTHSQNLLMLFNRVLRVAKSIVDGLGLDSEEKSLDSVSKDDRNHQSKDHEPSALSKQSSPLKAGKGFLSKISSTVKSLSGSKSGVRSKLSSQKSADQKLVRSIFQLAVDIEFVAETVNEIVLSSPKEVSSPRERNLTRLDSARGSTDDRAANDNEHASSLSASTLAEVGVAISDLACSRLVPVLVYECRSHINGADLESGLASLFSSYPLTHLDLDRLPPRLVSCVVHNAVCAATLSYIENLCKRKFASREECAAAISASYHVALQRLNRVLGKEVAVVRESEVAADTPVESLSVLPRGVTVDVKSMLGLMPLAQKIVLEQDDSWVLLMLETWCIKVINLSQQIKTAQRSAKTLLTLKRLESSEAKDVLLALDEILAGRLADRSKLGRSGMRMASDISNFSSVYADHSSSPSSP